MPLYRYKAITSEGKRITRTLRADSPAEVAQYLNDNTLFAVEIVDTTKRSKKIGLKTSDKIFFTQNLSVLLTSGISLGPALAAISADASNKSTAAFYDALRSDLEKGAPLSKALAAYPTTFDPIYLSLIEAGENSGKLDVVMDNLTQSLEREVQMYGQVKNALMYPAFVFGSLLLLILLIVFFVLPRLTKVFEDLNVKLPLMTRLLVRFGAFAGEHPLILLSIVFAFIGAIAGIAATQRGRKWLASMIIKLPLIKPIVNNLDLSRLSSTLSLLLNAGVPIQKAILIAGETIRNPRLRTDFHAAQEKLANGATLGQAFTESALPRTFVSLVSLGEQSGSTASIFQNLSKHYQNLLDLAIKNFTGVLEPVLTLTVGLMVGGVVITVMLPMYQFIGNIANIK